MQVEFNKGLESGRIWQNSKMFAFAVTGTETRMERESAGWPVVEQWLEQHREQMEAALIAWLRIPSVKGPAAPGAPFGVAVAAALEQALQTAAAWGLTTQNVDGYCGLADLPGRTAEQIGVLGHVDVVPAEAADWTGDPFQPRLADGRIYARGTEDDKGPLLAALFAGAALKANRIPLSKTVRFLFGCDEESGMGCVRYYLTRFAPPTAAFSPDSHFPLVHGEKGIAHYRMRADWPADTADGLYLHRLHGGTAVNILPASATAELSGEVPESALPDGIALRRENGRLLLAATGEAAHASQPGRLDNAIVRLAACLAQLPLAPAGARDFLARLAACYGDHYGCGLGWAETTAQGQLTSVLSQLDLTATGADFTADLRFLFRHTTAEYRERAERLCAAQGWRLCDWQAQEPLYVPPDSPLVQTLLRAYRDVTGDDSPPLLIGGGTYAKAFPNCLAFGPVFPGQTALCHQADEAIGRDDLLRLSKIYAKAIWALAE